MKIIITLLIAAIILLPGCSRSDLSVQFLRNPVISCTVDAATWKASSYSITGPAKVVVYPANPSLPGSIYYRFSIMAGGQDSQGNSLQLNIFFDTDDSTRLTGTYRKVYAAGKGLQIVQLFNNSTLAAYSLCALDSLTPLLQINKQSQSERLIAGSFKMTLCNTRDTSQKTIISNGLLSDINY